MAIQINAIQFHKKLHFLMTVLLFCLSALVLSGCEVFAQEQELKRGSPVMKTSVSSDGHYAVTSHFNGELVLWDLEAQSQEIITETANIYSAYFVQNTDYFMWQDALTDEVIVQSIEGNEVKRFALDFPSYGQVLTSDLEDYFASAENWDTWHYREGEAPLKLHDSATGGGFTASGKLFNLTLSFDDKYLLTAGDSNKFQDLPLKAGKTRQEARANGYSAGVTNTSILEGVVLWDIEQGLPIGKVTGHGSKTHARLSPDGQYVVSGDEAGGVFIWDAD